MITLVSESPLQCHFLSETLAVKSSVIDLCCFYYSIKNSLVALLACKSELWFLKSFEN